MKKILLLILLCFCCSEAFSENSGDKKDGNGKDIRVIINGTSLKPHRRPSASDSYIVAVYDIEYNTLEVYGTEETSAEIKIYYNNEEIAIAYELPAYIYIPYQIGEYKIVVDTEYYSVTGYFELQ